jgi:hypothetical protein
MKRSTLAKLIAPILTQRNTGHYSYNELEHAQMIIKQLEEFDLLKPTHKKTITRMCMMGTPYEDTITVEGWEKE